MAITYLAPNSATLAAAAWDDATGFAANATLAVDRHSGTISEALDQSGAGNVDYFHVRPGASPIFADPVSIAFDATYTTAANFIWAADGGQMVLTSGSTTITRAEFLGGGEVHLSGGTLTEGTVSRGTVKFLNGLSFSSSTLYVMGGNVFIGEKASNALTNLYVLGGRCTCWRTPTNIFQGGGELVLRAHDSDPTKLDLYGGKLTLLAGSLPTANLFGGTLDATRATRALTIGGTALNRFGTSVLGRDAAGGIVTISNDDPRAPISIG